MPATNGMMIKNYHYTWIKCVLYFVGSRFDVSMNTSYSSCSLHVYEAVPPVWGFVGRSCVHR